MNSATSVPEPAVTIAGLVERARRAQQTIEFASQEEVELVTARVAWACVNPAFTHKVAEFCVAESGMGCVLDKDLKIQNKVRGAYRDMKGKPSVGIVEDNKELGLLKIAKPMGVVGAVIPVTNPEVTPCCKALFALKTRNAIIMAPHPRAIRTNAMVAEEVRSVLRKHGWPEDLVIPIENVSIEATKELMRQCDIVLATGGAAMVNTAYSSGTPSQGVGVGNTVCIVDETADLKSAASLIARSKTFDNATSCSSENSLVMQERVYTAMIHALEAEGGCLVSPADKQKLQGVLWNEKGLSPKIVGQPAGTIAGLAGIDLPSGKRFLMVEETGVGKAFPFSGEKLSVITTLYRFNAFKEAIGLVDRITSHCGRGHSCGIHTALDDRVRELALAVKVSRIMVRQPQSLANSGAWTNGMPVSLTLGCGSWGRNSTSANVTWEHLLNYTWVSYPLASTQPSDRELFGRVMDEP